MGFVAAVPQAVAIGAAARQGDLSRRPSATVERDNKTKQIRTHSFAPVAAEGEGDTG